MTSTLKETEENLKVKQKSLFQETSVLPFIDSIVCIFLMMKTCLTVDFSKLKTFISIFVTVMKFLESNSSFKKNRGILALLLYWYVT